MAQRVLSIDIREDIICGALLSVTQRTTSVISCSAAVQGDRTLSESIREILLHVGYTDEPCRISIGAEYFFFRNLFFPFSDKRKIDKILPFELDENIPVAMESLLVDSLVITQKSQHSTVIAAMLERDFFRELLAELATLPLDPEIIAISHIQTALQLIRQQSQPDFVLLDAGCRKVTLFVVSDSRIRLVRTIAFDDGNLANFVIDKNSQLVSARRPDKIEATLAAMCREIKHTLFTLTDVSEKLPMYLTGPLSELGDTALYIGKNLEGEILPCTLVQQEVKIGLECRVWRNDLMTGSLALGLRSGKKQLGFNFRKEEFARKYSFRKYKKLIPKLGIPALLCLVLAIGFIWNEYLLKEKKLDALRKQHREIFMATLPEITRISDPVKQLQIEIRELKKATLGKGSAQTEIKVLDIMAEVSVRIPKSLNVHVIRMVSDQNGILLRGLTDNFNTVDNLKKVLEKSPYFENVTISSANLATKNTGIRFELKLQLNRG